MNKRTKKQKSERGTRPWNGSGWISKAERLAIYIRDRFTCQACGTDLRNHAAQDVTLDHIRCWKDGGADDASNLVTCCRKCNLKRGCTRWTKFYPAGAHGRVRNALRRRINLPAAKSFVSENSAAPAIWHARRF